ncbi:uncharacterized protein LOC128236514 isoform X2 [Mya arenaria]|uniref:uncharacterized protein LOC128236514 isoform X2 n=1 Tax=Mya arenaria TaxID=6604 RepID=UPI0022E34EA3|nr:uncharacterized protein LOC128236514 isoform X2 [Mya arenaria]
MMVIARTVLWYFAVSLTFHIGGCLTCLKGDDLLEPRLSMTVIDCPDAHVCYAKRTVNGFGEQGYNLGCIASTACSNVSTSSQCVHCCGENLCNHEACGVPGYPLDRGVICYSCHNNPQPENRCHNVDVCKSWEECQVVGRDIFGRTVYTTSCVVKGACGVNSPETGLIGKRSKVIRSSQSELLRRSRETKCTMCCDTDLCNRNCDNATSSSPIGYTSASPVITTPAGQSSCRDSQATCNLLDKNFYCKGDYFSWALTNCKSFCGYCDYTTDASATIPITTHVYFGEL